MVHDTTRDEKHLLGYDEERVLVLSELWHNDSNTLLNQLLNTPTFIWIGNPASFLTNGKTTSDSCSVNLQNPNQNPYEIVPVKQGMKYRLRLVGANTLFALYFSIPNHQMTVVEVEGTLVKPIKVDQVEILPGQRISVIIEANQRPDNYYMQQVGKWRSAPPLNGFSILHYESAPPPSNAAQHTLLPVANETVGWINDKLEPLPTDTTESLPLEQPSETIILKGKQIKYGPNGTQRRWTLNDIVYELPSSSSLLEMSRNNQLDSLPVQQKPSFTFKKDQIVDIVFQNTVTLNGICEVHPYQYFLIIFSKTNRL